MGKRAPRETNRTVVSINLGREEFTVVRLLSSCAGSGWTAPFPSQLCPQDGAKSGRHQFCWPRIKVNNSEQVLLPRKHPDLVGQWFHCIMLNISWLLGYDLVCSKNNWQLLKEIHPLHLSGSIDKYSSQSFGFGTPLGVRTIEYSITATTGSREENQEPSASCSFGILTPIPITRQSVSVSLWKAWGILGGR